MARPRCYPLYRSGEIALQSQRPEATSDLDQKGNASIKSERSETEMAKTMTPTNETNGLKKQPEVLVQDLKQVQKVMDLATGSEDATITVVCKRYAAPVYDEKEYGGTEAEFEAALFKAATELVQPVSKQIESFLYRATQDSYQAGKTEALAAGNFLTSDLKGRIVQVMRGNQAFVDLTAKECFERWKAGYAAKKAGATKVLETAKALGDFGDDL